MLSQRRRAQGPELGAAETLCDTVNKMEGPIESSDEGSEEGALLKLFLHDGDEGGLCLKRRGWGRRTGEHCQNTG